MNLVEYLGTRLDRPIIVLTNRKSKLNKLQQYQPGLNGVKVVRIASQVLPIFLRYVNYVAFYSKALFYVLKYQPTEVLYVETLSSWPALIYKKLKGEKVKLMVHYHEYTELELYAREMKMSRFMHKLERKMYAHFSWISHTNPVRLQLFKDEHGLEGMPASTFHVLPNYPPAAWLSTNRDGENKSTVKKMVFVGSLGYDNMYIQEIVDWIGCRRGEFCLDVYSYNIDKKAKEILENTPYDNIKYYGGCDYQSLPEILSGYDIGLDIYKPYALNHVHGVSNKVFEYLACGLDVWFSVDKSFTLQFARENVYPKIIPVNFGKLDAFDYMAAMNRHGLPFRPSGFFYENVYVEILNFINTDGR